MKQCKWLQHIIIMVQLVVQDIMVEIIICMIYQVVIIMNILNRKKHFYLFETNFIVFFFSFFFVDIIIIDIIIQMNIIINVQQIKIQNVVVHQQ